MLLKKKYTFVSSMPRSGQTVLASLLHQNKNICFTPQSQVLLILDSLLYHKTYSSIYSNFPAEEAYDNVVSQVFNLYYDKFTDANYILERAPWGLDTNRTILDFFDKKPKFIVIHRPVLECLASLMRVETPWRDKKVSTTLRCNILMANKGAMYQAMHSSQEIVENEDHLLITYNDIVTDPVGTVKKIHEYIGCPFEEIRTTNLDQYEMKNVKYFDHLLDGIPHQGLHDIRTDSVKRIEYDIEKYLPLEVIKQYEKADLI